MAAVDVSAWMEFRVGDLFEIYRGKRHPVNDHTEGEIPYYAASLDNNGITDHIGNPIFTDENALVITIFGDAFWASGEFTACDDCTVLKHADMSELSGLFVASAYMAANKDKYSFSLKAFSGRISEDTLKLPATDDGQPDWAYMEAYMGSVMERQAAVVDALSRMAAEKRPVDVGQWVEFDLIGKDGIFKEYERGKVSVARDLSDGDTPYVGAVFPKNNNGVQRYVTPKSEGQVTKGNCLVMVCDGAAIGCNMYQPSDFVGTTNLKIVRNEHLNELTGLFLASALDASTRRSGYSYFWKRNDENIRKEKIKLPATSDGEPDWAYMEEYMRAVMERQEHVVEVLSRICKH